jgi:transcriptional regulator with XRE-family HTH domain
LLRTEAFGLRGLLGRIRRRGAGKESTMIIGDRLRVLREQKHLSQGDIERKTGLLRCYVSRVENGHTVPSIETLEKLARALEVPLYQLFYEGETPLDAPDAIKDKSSDKPDWGSTGREAIYLRKLRELMGETAEEDRKLVLFLTQKLATRNRAQ